MAKLYVTSPNGSACSLKVINNEIGANTKPNANEHGYWCVLSSGLIVFGSHAHPVNTEYVLPILCIIRGMAVTRLTGYDADPAAATNRVACANRHSGIPDMDYGIMLYTDDGVYLDFIAIATYDPI